MEATASVELLHVSKRYGATLAVHDLSLTLYAGEFFSLLGPSGCGKTTTLRLIGGLEHPDQGTIRIAGEDVTTHPPYTRRANIVFQNYALFPHLSVHDNIAYGLHRQRLGRTEIAHRVAEALALVQLGDLGARRPQQLSGGQQQRVALARALVLRPHVLLLDEPLGALDRQLRKTMQRELRRIQQDVRMTFLYVTHDQEEALGMSDRLAVMRHGVIEQLGTPQEVFQTPRTPFVADFMGAANLFRGTVTACTVQHVRIAATAGWSVTALTPTLIPPGTVVHFLIRPDAIRFVQEGTDASPNTCQGRVTGLTYLGEVTEVDVLLETGSTLISRVSNRLQSQPPPVRNAMVRLAWDAEACHVFRTAPPFGCP